MPQIESKQFGLVGTPLVKSGAGTEGGVVRVGCCVCQGFAGGRVHQYEMGVRVEVAPEVQQPGAAGVGPAPHGLLPVGQKQFAGCQFPCFARAHGLKLGGGACPAKQALVPVFHGFHHPPGGGAWGGHAGELQLLFNGLQVAPGGAAYDEGVHRVVSGCGAVAAVGVIEANYVVFAQVGARLDFDDVQGQLSGVFELVAVAEGDVRGLIFGEQGLGAVNGDFGRAADNHPVFCAVVVHLQREFLARVDHQVLDLEAFAAVHAFVPAPRAVHAPVFEVLGAGVGAKLLDELLDLLGFVQWHDQHGIGCFNHGNVAHA